MSTFYKAFLCLLMAGMPFAVESPTVPVEWPKSLDPTRFPGNPDPRVKKVLDKLGLKYTIDDDGDYKLKFGLDDERSQIVWINSKTDEIVEWEVRRIFSLCYASKTAPPTQVIQNLMTKNGDYKLGATYLTQTSDAYGIIFAVTVSANASEKELKAALYAAAITADEIEKELLGSDNL